MAAGWSLLIIYKDCNYLVAKLKGVWSLEFLYKYQNSVRGPIFDISKGVSNMIPRLNTTYFYVFCHSFLSTITFQRNLEITYFRILSSHCAVLRGTLACTRSMTLTCWCAMLLQVVKVCSGKFFISFVDGVGFKQFDFYWKSWRFCLNGKIQIEMPTNKKSQIIS